MGFFKKFMNGFQINTKAAFRNEKEADLYTDLIVFQV